MFTRTLCADRPQWVHVVLVDKLLLQHHLDGDDDLGHDDQQIPCGKNEGPRVRTGLGETAPSGTEQLPIAPDSAGHP